MLLKIINWTKLSIHLMFVHMKHSAEAICGQPRAHTKATVCFNLAFVLRAAANLLTGVEETSYTLMRNTHVAFDGVNQRLSDGSGRGL